MSSMNRERQIYEGGPRRGHAFIKIVAVLALLAAVGFIAFRSYTAFPGDESYFTVLLIGEDKNYLRNGVALDAPGRPDAMLVLAVPRKPGPSLLLSVPRDTLVRYPSGARKRVNAAIGIGGIEMACDVVSDLLGLKIHRHIAVDFGGFTQLVDALGGVDIEVDKRMKYTDIAGGYSLNLEPGMHHMDGETALKYVRFRNDALGDIARTARQQRFLKAVISELAGWKGIRGYRSVLRLVQEYTDTDLSVREMAAIGWRLRSIDPSSLNTTTLPGSFNDPYWEPDHAGISSLMESLGLVRLQ